MRRIVAIPVFILSNIIAAYAADLAEPIRIELRDMHARGQEYIGRRIVTSGCLVDASPHGEFARPCGTSNWKLILLLDGPVEVFPAAMFGLNRKPGESVEADILGVLAIEPNERASGSHFILRVERISHVVVHKP